MGFRTGRAMRVGGWRGRIVAEQVGLTAGVLLDSCSIVDVGINFRRIERGKETLKGYCHVCLGIGDRRKFFVIGSGII
jgi:hypothetical protein